MDPLVSIIIPLYNTRKYISEAIDSALTQTYQNIEIIVVDDGSSDSSYELVKEKYSDKRVKLLSHEERVNKGVSKTRKLGIQSSKGSYIAFLDSDDVFKADKIEVQVRFMQNNPSVILCHGPVNLLYDDDKSAKEFANEFNLKDSQFIYSLKKETYFLKTNMICNSTVLVKSDSLLNLDFEANQLFQFEDWLTWVLLSEKGDFAYMPQKMIFYRYHNSSVTSSIVKNRLIGTYSYLEFLLTLLTKTKDNSIKLKIRVLLKGTIIKITESYVEASKKGEEDYYKVLFGASYSMSTGFSRLKKFFNKFLNK